jgi:hypothetical protein
VNDTQRGYNLNKLKDKAMQKIRKIQVGYQKSFSKKYHLNRPMKPKLILVGNWLAEAGFQSGSLTNVQISAKQIIISVA